MRQSDAIRVCGNAVRFPVRLTPKGGRDAVEGWVQGGDGRLALKLRVAAPPEGGKANRSLVALLAACLGVAASAVCIISGETARLKVIQIEGNTAALKTKLDALDRIL